MVARSPATTFFFFFVFCCFFFVFLILRKNKQLILKTPFEKFKKAFQRALTSFIIAVYIFWKNPSEFYEMYTPVIKLHIRLFFQPKSIHIFLISPQNMLWVITGSASESKKNMYCG